MSDEPRKPIEFSRANGPPTTGDPHQEIFDTVVGPNLRLKDNLIQLGVIVAGTILGAVGGRIYAATQPLPDRVGPVILGGFAGLLLSLFLSGTILGLIRGYRAMKN